MNSFANMSRKAIVTYLQEEVTQGVFARLDSQGLARELHRRGRVSDDMFWWLVGQYS